MVAQPTARAQQLLFDSLTTSENNGFADTYYQPPFSIGTTNYDNQYMGGAYVLPTGTKDITGFDVALANVTGTTYNAVEMNFYVWGTVNLTGNVSASTPAFSNLLGEYSFIGGGTFNSGYLYYYDAGGSSPSLPITPLLLNGSTTIGITTNIEGSTDGGTTFNSSSNLTSMFSLGDQPAVGQTAINAVYFGQQGIDTNGNFTAGSVYFTDANNNALPYQNLVFRLFGDTTGSFADSWNNSGGGAWETGSNWSNNQPPGSGADAIFNLSSPAPGYTVSLAQADACLDLLIQNDNVTISTSNPFANLTVGNTISVGNGSIGSLTLNNGSGGGTPSNFSAGSVLVGTNGGTGLLVVGSNVNLVSAGTITIGAGSALNISGGKVYAPSLSLAGTAGAWTGKLDIGTGSLDLANASLATVTSQAAQGYNGGTWNASGGITSAAAAADTYHLTAVGVISNNVSGSALYGSSTALGLFEGLSPGLNDVLVKYTYYGDCLLQGSVNGSDYSIIDNTVLQEHFVKGVPTNPISGWANGDFNYDGVVNGSDYTLMDNAFNQQSIDLGPDLTSAPPAVSIGNGDVATDVQYSSAVHIADGSIAQTDTQVAGPAAVVGGSPVPEPASLGLLAIGAVGMLSRRTRRA